MRCWRQHFTTWRVVNVSAACSFVLFESLFAIQNLLNEESGRVVTNRAEQNIPYIRCLCCGKLDSYYCIVEALRLLYTSSCPIHGAGISCPHRSSRKMSFVIRKCSICCANQISPTCAYSNKLLVETTFKDATCEHVGWRDGCSVEMRCQKAHIVLFCFRGGYREEHAIQ